MDFQRGRIVLSKAGRDKGRFLIVLSSSGGMALIADGKERPMENPKRKKFMHLQLTDIIASDHCIATNREIRRVLAPFNGRANVT